MAAGNGNRAPRIQLGADQQGAAPFATRNGRDGVGWLLSEKLVTIHDAVFNGAFGTSLAASHTSAFQPSRWGAANPR